MVELIKIRTLAEAGVPLARVRELLQADEEEFAAAVADIDKRQRAESRGIPPNTGRTVQVAALPWLATVRRCARREVRLGAT